MAWEEDMLAILATLKVFFHRILRSWNDWCTTKPILLLKWGIIVLYLLFHLRWHGTCCRWPWWSSWMRVCPVASIILDAASSRLPTTFSSRSSTPFQVSWIASIALIMELSPCATYSKVAPRALPIPITCRHPHDPFGGLLFPALWRSEKSSNIV